jgi:hypothetical protein
MPNITPFDRYIGVDWSGARGPTLKGLQVAVCEAGISVPTLVRNPAGGHWTRPDFVAWLSEQLSLGPRILCGMDFSFCFPWRDRGAYFPGLSDDPDDWQDFWQRLESCCASDTQYFGGDFVQSKDFKDHFAEAGRVGNRYTRRLRMTEIACQEQGLGTPESVFNLRGPRQVGKGSLAGMRVLRELRQNTSLAVWPFDSLGTGSSAIVETFPTAFVRLAGLGAGKIRELEDLQAIVDHYGSSLRGLITEFTDDEADALITATALRYHAHDSDLWHPAGLSDRVRRYEGWTFGVR